jgi:L-alanine-DL-glutamate epimerase-like enolase superfamily enzyme
MTRKLIIGRISWPLKEPFVISRGVQTTSDVVVVRLEQDDLAGLGEAVGVEYHGETLGGLEAQILSVKKAIENGADRQQLLELLPAGGARNALDAALWDLEAKLTGVRVWQRAGVGSGGPVTSAITIGIRELDAYEKTARALSAYPWIKVKVAAQSPLEAIAAVRAGAPKARLVVDPNQAWSVAQLREHAPRLLELGVDLLEQPVPVDGDHDLIDYRCPIPICADEAVDTVADLAHLEGRYDFINIKLDKTGGLTEALVLADAARARGFRLMVGCMVGGSVAMAPSMVLGQLCEVCDLDGPLLQAEDWVGGIVYDNGVMTPPWPCFWG